MTQAFLPGDPPIPITLRRSPQARRLTLRVSRQDGRVTLSLPVRTPEAEALAFARAQEAWLRRTLAARPPERRLVPGATLPVEGRDTVLQPAALRAPRLEGDTLLVPGTPAQLPARVAAFLKVLARDRLAAASDRHAAALGLAHAGITLRDTRSRWGSCAADGRLMYSWRLAMAPPEVLDYVAAHEVAHLAQMNHSPAFWAVVARLCPGYAAPRAWLRQHGAALQQVRFA
jgi:predicted metal-dependent hydrolase